MNIYPSPEYISTFPRPNYVNPETRGPSSIVIGIILVSLVTVIIGLRVFTRRFVSRGFGLDDILILAAYVSRYSLVLELKSFLTVSTDAGYSLCHYCGIQGDIFALGSTYMGY